MRQYIVKLRTHLLISLAENLLQKCCSYTHFSITMCTRGLESFQAVDRIWCSEPWTGPSLLKRFVIIPCSIFFLLRFPAVPVWCIRWSDERTCSDLKISCEYTKHRDFAYYILETIHRFARAPKTVKWNSEKMVREVLPKRCAQKFYARNTWICVCARARASCLWV